MRSGVINANSPMQDVLGVLTGIWTETNIGPNKEWHICKTPFFIHMDAVLQKGRNELPIAPQKTCALYWTAKDSSGSVVCRVGQTGFDLPENAYVEITMFGSTGGNDAH